ncbi:MAG: hypothetical protein EOO60_04530 [Hymenobacter sp.]|nr:MAG: hypothetical protein EOO60_04530 [Hymenobacter sp.]
MPLPTNDEQLNEPQLLAEVTRLATDLRMIRTQLEMEQQQAVAVLNTHKRTEIKQALSMVVHKKKPETVLAQLEAISQAKCPWIPSATRGKDDVLDAIGEVINDGSKIGQSWLALLRTYGMNSVPSNPLLHR